MKPKLISTLMLSLGIVGLLITALPVGGEAPAPAAPDLTILYTNDVWGYLEPCG